MSKDEAKRVSLALERQLAYMENRMGKLLELLEPDKALIFKKETRRAMHKISTQADIDHEQAINSKKQQLTGKGADDGRELELIAGEIIKTKEIGTDMFDHGEYLHEMNGGPLTLEL